MPAGDARDAGTGGGGGCGIQQGARGDRADSGRGQGQCGGGRQLLSDRGRAGDASVCMQPV